MLKLKKRKKFQKVQKSSQQDKQTLFSNILESLFFSWRSPA